MIQYDVSIKKKVSLSNTQKLNGGIRLDYVLIIWRDKGKPITADRDTGKDNTCKDKTFLFELSKK